MKKSRSATARRLYRPRASLEATGLKLRSLKLLDRMAERVHIRQKTIEDAPRLKKYGVQGMERDVMGVSGYVEVGNTEAIKRMILKRHQRHCAIALMRCKHY